MPALQTDIQKQINKLVPDSEWVQLITLDGSAFGGVVFRLTNNPLPNGGPPQFSGAFYQPLPIRLEGFDVTASGTMAKPTITIGDVGKVLMAQMDLHGDFVGWKFYRTRTFAKHLDNGSAPNPGACVGPELWIVEKLLKRSAEGCVWQLTTSLDRMSFKTGRQILKDPSVKNLYAPGVARTRVSGR